MSIDQLTTERCNSPPRKREKLAQILWASLNEDDFDFDDSYEAELLTLTKERTQQLESSEVKPIPHEEVMKRL